MVEDQFPSSLEISITEILGDLMVVSPLKESANPPVINNDTMIPTKNCVRDITIKKKPNYQSAFKLSFYTVDPIMGYFKFLNFSFFDFAQFFRFVI